MFSHRKDCLYFLVLLSLMGCSQTVLPQTTPASPTAGIRQTAVLPSEVSPTEPPQPGSLTPSFELTQQPPASITPLQPDQKQTAYPGYPGVNTPGQPPLSGATLTPVTILLLSPSPLIPLSQSFHLDALRMFDAVTGWAMYLPVPVNPSMSRVLHASPGPVIWKNASPSITDTVGFYPAASFVNPNTAVVAVTRRFLSGSGGTEIIPWRTTDGGQTWQPGELLKSGGLDQASQIVMLDQDIGWMLVHSDATMGASCVSLYETKDSGAHWKAVYDYVAHCTSGDQNALKLLNFYPYRGNVIFVSSSKGFFSNGRLYSSEDAGQSWQYEPLAPPSAPPELNCLDTDTCKYSDVVSAPQFASSQDGTLLRRVYPTSVLHPPFIGGEQYHLPLPTAQYLYYTHDGGKSWIPDPSPAKIGTNYFLNAQTGWFLGKSESDPSTPTQLYQTRDGGGTWTQISAACPLPLGSEIEFVDDKIGFAFLPFPVSRYYQDFDARVGKNGAPHFFFTKDGGQSWEKTEMMVGPASP